MRTDRFPRGVLLLIVVFTVLAAPTARLQTPTFSLTINMVGLGSPPISGAVGVTPIGRVCNGPNGTSCTYQVPSGIEIRINANQPAGSTPGVFSNGTGAATGCATSTCRFTMNDNAAITATFDPSAPKVILSITLDGEGEVGANNNRCQNYDHTPSNLPTQFSACGTSYAPGSEATIEARHQAGGRFVGYSEGTLNASACGSGGECRFVLDANTSVKATFTALTSMAISPASATKSVNQSQQFTAKGTYANGDVVDIVGNMGTWKTKASMQVPRFDLSAAVAGDFLYALGGISNGGPTDSVERYDPSNNTWTFVAPLPSARAGFGAAAVDGKIYVAGGSVANACPTDAFDVYDPGSNTWAALAPLPGGPRRFLEAVAVGRMIYVIGGELNDCNTTSGNILNRVEVYDVDANAWSATPAANMPTARRFFGAAAVDGLIYVAGGEGIGNGPLASLEAYNPATNTWSARAPMQRARGLVAAAAIDKRLYVLGGNSNGYTNEVSAYDPASNQWNNKAFIPSLLVNDPQIPNPGPGDLPGSRAELAAATMGGTMYELGGLVFQDGTHVPYVSAFNDHLIWTSGTTAVATINSFGQAIAKSVGSSTISARAGTVTCADTGGSCATFTVAPAANTAPTVTLFGPSQIFIQEGQSIFVGGSFRDPDLTQTWTATANYGDDTGNQPLTITPGSNPPQSPNGSFQANHVYMTPGNYTATVTVRDSGTPQGVGSASVQVVVQPNQGGGGGEEECGNVNLTIVADGYPLPTLTAALYENGEFEDFIEVPIAANHFETEAGAYRLVFQPAPGFVAVPAELDFTLACEQTVSFTVQVRPVDTQPPVIASVTPSPDALWPPNNKMVDVSLSVSATDNSGAPPACSIVSVSSSDPGSNDWQFSPNSLSLSLRAKRSGQAARVYTVTVQCTDAAGNSATQTTTVTVPHDQRR